MVNSFMELKPVFVDAYKAGIAEKIRTIRPLFLMSTVPSTATIDDTNAIQCAS